MSESRVDLCHEWLIKKAQMDDAFCRFSAACSRASYADKRASAFNHRAAVRENIR